MKKRPSRLKERGREIILSLPFCSIWAPGVHNDTRVHWGQQISLLVLQNQMRILSRNTHRPRNTVFLAIGATLRPVKLTHELKHHPQHALQPQNEVPAGLGHLCAVPKMGTHICLLVLPALWSTSNCAHPALFRQRKCVFNENSSLFPGPY